MYIVAQHRIKDPARFWSLSPEGPGAPTLHAAYPSNDKTRGVCLWQSDSIDALRDSLDTLVGDAAENTYVRGRRWSRGRPSRARDDERLAAVSIPL
jgi:hypothetical protein